MIQNRSPQHTATNSKPNGIVTHVGNDSKPGQTHTDGTHNVDIDVIKSDLRQHIVSIQREDTTEKQKEQEITVLGVQLHHWPKSLSFFFCLIGVFFFYVIYGYMQELIFKLDGMKPFGWYLTLVQFGFYSVFGVLEIQTHVDKQRKIPMKTYGFLAFLTVATMGLSNTSVGYLNYPTQVVFKCCKLIPVMIGGVLIQGKRYNSVDVVAVLCMSVGLILFTLADVEVSPKFDQTGVILISLALCADAVIGNVQEKTMRRYHATNTEVVFYSYSIGFLYILCGLIIHGSLLDAYRFFAQQPKQTYGYAFIFSVTGYLGISFVLALVKSFGALLAVTVTTCRKAVTMVLSFMFFTKPFTINYVWSGLVVVLGILLNVYSKNRHSCDRLIADFVRKCIIKIQMRSQRYASKTISV